MTTMTRTTNTDLLQQYCLLCNLDEVCHTHGPRWFCALNWATITTQDWEPYFKNDSMYWITTEGSIILALPGNYIGC